LEVTRKNNSKKYLKGEELFERLIVKKAQMLHWMIFRLSKLIPKDINGLEPFLSMKKSKKDIVKNLVMKQF